MEQIPYRSQGGPRPRAHTLELTCPSSRLDRPLALSMPALWRPESRLSLSQPFAQSPRGMGCTERAASRTVDAEKAPRFWVHPAGCGTGRRHLEARAGLQKGRLRRGRDGGGGGAGGGASVARNRHLTQPFTIADGQGLNHYLTHGLGISDERHRLVDLSRLGVGASRVWIWYAAEPAAAAAATESQASYASRAHGREDAWTNASGRHQCTCYYFLLCFFIFY